MLAGHLANAACKLEFEKRGKDFRRLQLAVKPLDQGVELDRLIVPQLFEDEPFRGSQIAVLE